MSPLVLVDDAKSTRNATSSHEAGTTALDWPLLPWPRGPLSASVIAALQGSPEPLVPSLSTLSETLPGLILLASRARRRITMILRWPLISVTNSTTAQGLTQARNGI
jgi:hypothetical protein